MPDGSPITIAVDAIGGDNAPAAVLEGITAALAADPHMRVILVGPSDVVQTFSSSHDRVEGQDASEKIEMGEHPAQAVRAKTDSSIVVGCRLVRDGRAQAFFSAGNSGATMAAATLVMGRIKGVSRPAIAAVIPTVGSPLVLLDMGANADCRAEHLAQFALMGAAYSRVVLGVTDPRVGLLNIGEEPTKGSQLALEAHALMSGSVPGFVGNVEGGDIPAGVVDVVVTDGFTGNVVLKLMEGMSKAILGQMREAMVSSTANKLAAAVLKPSLTRVAERLDADNYGAAPLLGVQGLALIGHGASNSRAVTSALRVGAAALRGDIVSRIEDALRSGDA